MAGLVVRMLGSVRVTAPDGGAEDGVALRGHAATVLAWLALRRGRTWSADELAGRLWRDGPPATARTVIQNQVSRLRKALAGSAVDITTTAAGYTLHAEPEAIDVLRFQALVERAASERAAGHSSGSAKAADLLTEALSLWGGDALGELRSDPQLAAEGAALDDQRRAAEDSLADALVAAGDHERALRLLGRLVNEDPLRERRWALLMIALTRVGRQADALRAYRQAAAVLVDRTGLDPGPELRRLETAILLQDPALDAARWQPAPGAAPVPLADVVGREAERAAVVARLAAGRLVTLVGPGGVGKSTLAVDVGAAAAAMFADGVIVVDLGSCGPDDVGMALATAVGPTAIEASAAPGTSEAGTSDATADGDTTADSGTAAHGGPGTSAAPSAVRAATDGNGPLARAASVLARREVLVVLDGCEHVRDEAAGAAVALLQAGPGLRVLATSQVALGIAGEAVVELPPLAIPDEGADGATIRRSPAAALLARRLDALGCPPDGNADWTHVAAVVRAVDGLPLAIEIAAAAARVEPLGVVARRLAGDASPIVAAPPPAGAGRRSLGATLDAAVDRLDPEAAALYAALGVFPGSFDAGAAAAAAGLDEATAAAALVRLAAASLVVREGPDRGRARLLQPVRAHAAARLGGTADEAAAARERVVGWCLTLAAELDDGVHSPDQAAVAARFTAELPTIRMVLRHLLDTADLARAALLFERLVLCWADSLASAEARMWGDELLAHADRLDDGPRARLEVAVVHTQFAFELIAARLDLTEAALQRAQTAGDPFAVAVAEAQVAIGLGWRNVDLDRATALLERSRAGMLALGVPYWAGVVLELQGLIQLRRLDVATGIATLEAAAAEHRAHGGPGDAAHALTYIGYARRAIGDLTGARRAFDEARRVLAGMRAASWLRATIGSGHASLAIGDTAEAAETFRAAHDRAVEWGDQRIVGTALVGLAGVARADGDRSRCISLLLAAAERALDGGDPTDAVTAAGILGDMLAQEGADEEAAVVIGAADLVHDEVGVRVDFGLAHDLDPLRAALAERLGEARMADLARDGRVIGLAAAVRRAGEQLLDDESVSQAGEAGHWPSTVAVTGPGGALNSRPGAVRRAPERLSSTQPSGEVRLRRR